MKTIIGLATLLCTTLTLSAQLQLLQYSTMNEYRESHGCANLFIAEYDGGVLACGGWTGDAVTASAEFYSIWDNEWLPMPDMLTPRMDFAMATLADGRVIVAGGYDGIGPLSLASTEIFDPETYEWTPGPDLSVGRSFLRVTNLFDGRLLFTGGFDGNDQVAAVDIFDPSTDTMTTAAPMNFARSSHTATAFYPGINNPKVLLAGGFNPAFGFQMNQCEMYDFETDTWTIIAPLNIPRDNHAALRNGLQGYITGGRVFDPGLGHFVALYEAEIYDYNEDSWTTVSMVSAMSYHHMMVRDASATVFLMVGGANHTGIGIETTYDPPFKWVLPEFSNQANPSLNFDNRLRSAAANYVSSSNWEVITDAIVVTGGDDAGVGTAELWGTLIGSVPDNTPPRNGLFPNPAVDRMRITGERFERWEVIDANGKIVGTGNEWYVEVAHLAAGRYNLTIYTDGTANTYGFVKVGR
jgi:hypothetical protein